MVLCLRVIYILYLKICRAACIIVKPHNRLATWCAEIDFGDLISHEGNFHFAYEFTIIMKIEIISSEEAYNLRKEFETVRPLNLCVM
jgi:hypothetical protein